MSNKIQVVAAALCIVALIGLIPGVFFGFDRMFLLAVALILGLVVLGLYIAGERFGLDRVTFLCDTCRYDNERDCRRPERPNATRCPDYRKRSSPE